MPPSILHIVGIALLLPSLCFYLSTPFYQNLHIPTNEMIEMRIIVPSSRFTKSSIKNDIELQENVSTKELHKGTWLMKPKSQEQASPLI